MNTFEGLGKLVGTLGKLVSAMEGNKNRGAMFPAADVKDFEKGARYIPSEVTLARRNGETVVFDREHHQWTLPDGTIVK